MSADLSIKLLKESLEKPVIVRLKGHRSIRGVLIGFDEHLNLVLRSAEFIHNEETRQLGDIVLRGDSVVFISPP
jgi:small nuclear ribonucleoprotein